MGPRCQIFQETARASRLPVDEPSRAPIFLWHCYAHGKSSRRGGACWLAARADAGASASGGHLSAIEAAACEAPTAPRGAAVRHEVALHRRLATRALHEVDVTREGNGLQGLPALHARPVWQEHPELGAATILDDSSRTTFGAKSRLANAELHETVSALTAILRLNLGEGEGGCNFITGATHVNPCSVSTSTSALQTLQ